MRSLILSILLLVLNNSLIAQQAKNGNYTVTAAGTVLNAYTDVTSDIAVNATTLSVSSNALTNTYFTSNLAAGDLILIIQMQGADLDIDLHPITSWGGNYTLSASNWNDFLAGNYSTVEAKRPEWGAVTNYNNSGKYEYAEVLSVSGTNTINVRCGLKNAYTSAGHVQVVRVPRIGNLTLNANATIVPLTWTGAIGGIVALEVNGTLNFGTNSKIVASGYGFRGGVTDNTSGGPGAASDVGKPGSFAASEGSEKGEGIGGASTLTGEVTTTYQSRYGCGAPANGGGGGNYKNSGGGGGSNIGTGTYDGKGVPTTGYAAFWNLEAAGMATTTSSGGGRGGYSGAQSDQNEATVGPNNSAWSGDSRRKEGGLGGHPLTYDATRVFMGGGGGAGEMDQNEGGSGGAGGGIVFLQSYGSITGTGTIEANGANGQNSNPTGATAGIGAKRGVDGAGGAGGGGAIVISNGTALPATLTLNANGGTGGNNALTFGNFTSGIEADGPGGGGGGGMIAFTSGTPVQSAVGGAGGVVTASGTTNIVANFPPNGATGGASGVSSQPQTYYNLTPNNASACSGNTANLSVTVQGTLPVPTSGVNWYATYTSTASLGTGLTFTTPALTATTTYYVGFCPGGTFRIPVTVTVGGPTISGTASVANATCTSGGSVTGLTTSGGAPSVTIDWNGVVYPTMNLTGASAGSYTVTVTDAVGCTATSGPYTIGSAGGPTVNTTNMVVTNASCLGGDGSITGITATGNGLTYSWNSGAYTTLNISNLNPGSYSLVVTDNVGCMASTGTIILGQTAGPVINTTNMLVTSTTCGQNNGSIAGITATGNGLTYQWNGTTATLDQSNLAAGSYTLIATDNIGCTATYGPVAIVASSAPVINSSSVVITDAHCNQSNGGISGITVSGGQTPYTYSWNSGAYTTLNLTNIPAGNYSFTVTDNLGCTASAGPFTVNNIAGPVINTSAVVITNESCTGNDGSITGITASGAGTLTYSWNLTPSATINHTNLTSGTYGLVVSDAFGCSAVAGPFTVNGPTPMSLNENNLVITPTTCTGTTGSITGLQVTGGVNPTVSWSNGPTTLNNPNLGVGSYTITVTDAQNCTVQHTYTVTTASGVVINTNNAVITNDNCAMNTGSISGVTVSGGTTPYSYSWNNSPTLNTLNISSLATGNYTLIVTDNGGCKDTTTLFVGVVPPSSINQAGVVVTNETCMGNNGTITGIQISGNGPYTYSWTGTSLTSLNLTNLDAGTYVLSVTDVNGCVTTGTPIVVGSNPVPHADFTIASTPASPGENIVFTDASSGGTIQTYAWYIQGVGPNGSGSSCTYNSLVEGNYNMTLVIQSVDGCIDSITKGFQILGELKIPNIITANGDHINDEFYITNLKPNSRLVIENRWGNLVFETNNYKNDWGGTDMSGQKLDDGVYFYQLITADGKMRQGNVHLLID